MADLLLDSPNFEDADAFYAALIDNIEKVGDDEAVSYLSRLVMILANQIGKTETLEAALKASLPED